MQLASTLGFCLDKTSGQFLGLRPEELDALHEVIQWGRQPGNNKVLNFFGQTLEDFSNACKAAFSEKFKDLLPKGRNCGRVRVTGKDTVEVRNGSTLGQTLGDETTGMVVVDLGEHPIRYNQLTVYENIVAKHKSVRFDVEATHDGRSWRRTQSSFDLDESTLNDTVDVAIWVAH